MLFRLIWLVVFLVLAAASANWLMGQPGQMQLEWLDWRIEIRTSLAVVLLIMLCFLLVFAGSSGVCLSGGYGGRLDFLRIGYWCGRKLDGDSQALAYLQ